MESYSITNKKLFMNQLLKAELFDKFEVREVIFHSSLKCIIDGKRNHDFYTLEELENLSPFLTWAEIRDSCYHLMIGQKLPTYFKIILATSLSTTQSISTEVDTCFLNITFKDNQMTCSTGVAYKTFTLDKSPEKTWDERIKNFLFKYEFI